MWDFLLPIQLYCLNFRKLSGIREQRKCIKSTIIIMINGPDFLGRQGKKKLLCIKIRLSECESNVECSDG